MTSIYCGKCGITVKGNIDHTCFLDIDQNIDLLDDEYQALLVKLHKESLRRNESHLIGKYTSTEPNKENVDV